MHIAGIDRVAHPVEALADLYYERLPKVLLRSTRSFVEPTFAVARRFLGAVGDLFPELTLVDVGRRSAAPLPLLVAGRGSVRGAFFERLFGSEPPGESLGRVPIWRVRARASGRTAATLIEADRRYEHLLARQGFVAIPEWVLFKLDISGSWEEIESGWRRHMRENLRRVRLYSYQLEATTDVERLRYFRERMFRPYIATRYGSEAASVSFGYMQNLLERGKLLLVHSGGEAVGGVLICTMPGKEPMIAFMGIKDADPELLRRGVSAALYFHCVRWLKEQGYQSIDFGHARPFLRDGLLSYKRRWGMKAERSDRKYRSLFLSLNGRNTELERVLVINPMVCEERGRLRALVYLRRGDVVRGDEVCVPGLDGVRPVSLGG